MTETRRALFLFPSDRMGGAERISRTLAQEALRSDDIEHLDCMALCWDRTGTLEAIEQDGRAAVHYARAPSHLLGLLAMVRFLLGKRYDLVFSSHLHINAICSFMRKVGLLRTRRLVSRESTSVFERKFTKHGWLIRMMYALYGSQDLIICQTEGMKRSLVANCPKKLHALFEVMPNPLDLEWIRTSRSALPPSALAAIPPAATTIVWCGRLTPVKAPERAVETLREIHAMGRADTCLVMLGDGPLHASVSELISRYGLADKILLLGHVNDPPSVMAQCRLGLLTSESEGFPNVVLEMLASGVRSVVTTDCADGLAGLPGVRVADAKTANSLAQALFPLLDITDIDAGVEAALTLRRPSLYYARMAGHGTT